MECPFTYDHILRVATQSPTRLAAVHGVRCLDYATLAQEIRQVADAMADIGIEERQIVVAGFGSLYVQLVVTLALGAMGAVSASFRVGEGDDCRELLAGADLVLTDGPDPRMPCRRLVQVAENWFETVLSEPCSSRARLPRLDAEAPLLIVRSSGTTGRPKRLVVTRGMFEARCANRADTYGMAAQTVYLTTTPLSSHTIQATIGTVLRLGGAVIAETGLPLPEALTVLRPTHASFLPHQLQLLLRELPPDAERVPGLTVVCTGAAVPAALRAVAEGRLCGRVADTYGTNETGVVCALDGDGEGALLPGVSASAVGADGEKLDDGKPGRVRLSGPPVATGYLDDPETTARCFKDGWFEPGDLGATLPGGRLRILGREGDVLNLGGLKTACADVEAVVAALGGVRDAAVLQQDVGLLVAIAAADPVTDALPKRVIDALSHLTADVAVRIVSEVPRTATGKIRRAALREMLAGAPCD